MNNFIERIKGFFRKPYKPIAVYDEYIPGQYQIRIGFLIKRYRSGDIKVRIPSLDNKSFRCFRNNRDYFIKR